MKFVEAPTWHRVVSAECKGRLTGLILLFRIQSPQSLSSSAVGALDPKFHAPATRSGVVARTTLLDRLFDSDEPVITVVAPPGYGKTTLLAQWAEHLGPRVAWVSCEKTDNDPVALWTAVITALGQIAPVSPAASQLLATSGGGVDVIPSLVSTFGTSVGRWSWCSTMRKR